MSKVAPRIMIHAFDNETDAKTMAKDPSMSGFDDVRIHEVVDASWKRHFHTPDESSSSTPVDDLAWLSGSARVWILVAAT